MAALEEGPRHDEPLAHFNSVPLEIRDIFEVYHSHYWAPSGIDLSLENESFTTLDQDDKHSVLGIIGFLFNSHETVTASLLQSLSNEIQNPEVKFFLSCQESMKSIHYEMSLSLIQAYIPDPPERMPLLISMQSFFSGKKDWIQRWIENKSVTFPVRFLALAVAERIFVSRCTALTQWLQMQHQNFCPGLSLAIEFICRDKELNTDFVCLLSQYLTHKPSEKEICDLVAEAEQIERDFFQTHFQVSHMNLSDVWSHIKSRAETLVEELGYKKAEETGNPLDVALEGNAFLNCIQSLTNRNHLKAAILPATNETPLIPDERHDDPAPDVEDWQELEFQSSVNDNKISLEIIFRLAAETGLLPKTVMDWFGQRGYPIDQK